MKRIIYGSLSVLTAIGTVFVASKAEVLGGDRPQTKASQETIESTQLGALPDSSKNGLEGLTGLDALSSSNSVGANGAKNGEAVLGAATAGNGLFAPGLNQGFDQGAENSSVLLTPKSNAGSQSAVAATPLKTGFSDGLSSEQATIAVNPATINSNSINSTIQTSQVPAPAAPTPKPSAGASTGTVDSPVESSGEAVDTVPATIQPEGQTLPTPGMDGSTAVPSPSLTGPSFSTPGSRGPILQLDNSAGDGSAETVVPASGAEPLTPAAPTAAPAVESPAAEPIESFEDDAAFDEDEAALDEESADTSVGTEAAEVEAVEDGSVMSEDPMSEDPMSEDPMSEDPLDTTVDDSMTDDGIGDGTVDDMSEEEPEEDSLEDDTSEGASFGEEPEMMEGDGALEDDSLENGSFGDDAIDDDVMDDGGMGDAPIMEDAPSEDAFEAPPLEEESLEEESLEEESLEEEPLEEESLEEEPLGEEPLGDDVAPDGLAPVTPVTPSDGFTPNGITPSAPNGITPSAPLEESPGQFPDETAPATPLPPTPVTPAPAAPPAAPVEPLDPSIEGDAFDSPAPLGNESDRLIGEGFTPFQLSYLAIGGGLKEAGIPGGELLLSAYEDGEVTAEDIVNAGAVTKRLGTAANDEADYTKGVDKFLKLLSRDGLSS